MRLEEDVRLIATHDGYFHADDVFAVAAITLVHPHAGVLRTRDPLALAQADIRVDIGGRYDPRTGDYDHHQGGIPPRRNGVPYASFGLVWKDLGATLAGPVASTIEHRLVLPIDYVDTFRGNIAPGFPLFDLGAVIASYHGPSPGENDPQFSDAVLFARGLLERVIRGERAEHEEGEALRPYFERGGPIVELPGPRKYHVVARSYPHVTRVVYARHDGKWNTSAVQHAGKTPTVPFPEEWRGKTGTDLESLTGVKDVLECPNDHFVVSRTREAALAVARAPVPHRTSSRASRGR